MDQTNNAGGLQVISPVFRDGSAIPSQYTCKGQNVNPSLNIIHKPAGTQSFTMVMHDPDAVSGDFLHWLVWDIPPSTETIPVNGLPVGAVQGKNGSGESIYTGPCPPKGTGTHHYIFDFYALDTTLDLSAGSILEEVLAAQSGHILDHCAITGTFPAEE